MNRGLALAPLLAAGVLAAGGAAQQRAASRSPAVEVVVALKRPPLARAAAAAPRLFAVGPRGRVSLATAASRTYLSSLEAAQDALVLRIQRAIPSARATWRYSVVLDAVAVTVPSSEVDRLESLPGVAHVYRSQRYRPLLDRSPRVIGAPALWGSNLEAAGNGIKIGIIDDGVDQTHPFFSPRGFAMPAGFPKGQTGFTTAKVIVARAFPPRSPTWRYASRPFDPIYSDHATHVAGIAAGDNGVRSPLVGTTVSGVAPRAYIGNYKVLTIPTPGVGLDGNSPEIAKGIEAAVRDGMDVINLSLGEPEIELSRDLVVDAIDGAADAGVVPVVAAGNDFNDFGFGSIASPGSAPKAITVGATTNGREIADFSSAGPTPVSLQLKPDVSAPGVSIVSSIPGSRWASFSGTSMAAPHVAGGAALLRQRHPTWTVAQLKSALVLTAARVSAPTASEVAATREGGGIVDLPAANDPLVFVRPTSLSFGLLRRGARAARNVIVTDAGAGAGSWSVALAQQRRAPGVRIETPQQVGVPGQLRVRVVVGRSARAREAMGFVLLTRAGKQRRIPYWLRVSVPRLARHRVRVLHRPGLYVGNTAGKPALVSSYRYPTDPGAAGLVTQLFGPEQVFRLTLRRRVANFGAVVTSESGGADLFPRVVRAGSEDRLVGYPGLPINLNPYLPNFGLPTLSAGAIRPLPGRYDIVFDSPSRATAGRFRFRFWIDDTQPPAVRLLARSVLRGGAVRAAVADRGSGVDATSIAVHVDGARRGFSYSARRHRLTIPLAGLAPGRHRLVVQVSDNQEAKNMEDVPRILPNTRRLSATIVVR